MKQLLLFGSEHIPSTSVAVNHEWQLFIDGAARNNPGPAGAGIFILKDTIPVYKNGFFLKKKTNNQAEYLALLVGLFILKQYMQTNDHASIASDSQLLVRQIQGQYKVKNPDLIKLFNVATRIIPVRSFTIRHIMREENEQADSMANHGIDIKNPLPDDFITLLHSYDITI